jgi:hypothetical protein
VSIRTTVPLPLVVTAGTSSAPVSDAWICVGPLVAVSVGEGVSVALAVSVGVSARVAVCVGVAVSASVGVALLVGVAVDVFVGGSVAVAVGVSDGGGVGDAVGVFVAGGGEVGVAVGGAVAVLVAATVTVGPAGGVPLSESPHAESRKRLKMAKQQVVRVRWLANMSDLLRDRAAWRGPLAISCVMRRTLRSGPS